MAAQRRKTRAASRRRPKAKWEVLLPYCLRFETERDLVRSDENEYVVELDGTIVHAEEGEPETEAGKISAFLLQAGRAFNDDESMFDAFDNHSVQLAEVAALVFDPDEEGIRESLRDGTDSDVLFLASVTILPEHRGRRLGQLAVQRTIDMFGKGCGIAVLRPFPMQQNRSMSKERRTKLALDGFDRNAKRATKRLADYWSELGFRAIGGEIIHPQSAFNPAPEPINPKEWYVRDLEAAGQPTIESFIRRS